jgi:hypothetical protein
MGTKLAASAADGPRAGGLRIQRVSDGKEFANKVLAPDPKYIDEAVFDEVATHAFVFRIRVS